MRSRGRSPMFPSTFLGERPSIRKSLKINMAEGVGFEPTDPCGSPVFKTGALNRSAIPPIKSQSQSLRFVQNQPLSSLTVY